MRQILLMIAVVALVGCGKKITPAEPVTKPESKVAAKKPEPPKAFTNTLGMKFVPVKGTDVQFCIWETRVKDYATYAAANAGVDASWKKPFGDDFKQADTHPVVMVSWKDANAFCEWLTKKELAEGKIKAGQKYRLPTDAEWSVAVGLGKEKGNTPEEKSRGIKDVYPWGKEWPPPVGVGNYAGSLNVDKFEYTSPAGSFAANKLGLHDMGGNVWEWCEFKLNANSTRHVLRLRGASWNRFFSPARLLSSYRYYWWTWDLGNPNLLRSDKVGFRCVLALVRSNSPDTATLRNTTKPPGNAATGPIKGEAVPASVVRNGRGSRLTWISRAGANYQVQSSNDRSSWNNVGNARSGQRTGFDSMSVNNGGQRYLRVIRID